MSRCFLYVMCCLLVSGPIHAQEKLDPDALDQVVNQPVNYREFGKMISLQALRVAANEIRASGKPQDSIVVDLQLTVRAIEDPITDHCRTEVCARTPHVPGFPCVEMCADPNYGELESPVIPTQLVPILIEDGDDCDDLWGDFRNANVGQKSRAWRDLIDAGCVVLRLEPILPVFRREN